MTDTSHLQQRDEMESLDPPSRAGEEDREALPGETILTLAHFQAEHPRYYHSLPSNDTFRLSSFMCFPFYSTRAFTFRLFGVFGPRFIFLCSSIYALKGFMMFGLPLVMLSFFKDILHIDGVLFQKTVLLANSPYILKGVLGILSDLFPIGGLHKKWYMILAAITGSLAVLLLIPLSGHVKQLNLDPSSPENLTYVWLTSFLFALVTFEVSFSDLLVEGRYVEEMRRSPFTGSDIVVWIWMVFFFFALVASLLVGFLSDGGHFQLILGCFLPIALQVFIPPSLGWLFERPSPLSEDEPCFQVSKAREHRNVFLLSLFSTLLAIGFTLTFFSSSLYLLIAALVCSILLSVSVWNAFIPPIAKAMVFILLLNTSYANIDGALSYFYTASPSCLPLGPHFAWSFFQSWSNLVKTVSGFLAVILFQNVFIHFPIRRLFWFTILLRVLASTFDLFIINKWNSLYFRIGDHAFYLIFVVMIGSILTMLELMAGVVFIAKLCPHGIETTSYAVNGTLWHFGSAFASAIGIFLTQNVFQIVSTESTNLPCDFSELSGLVMVAHVLLPLLVIPFSFWLLPDSRLTDDTDR